MIFLYIFFYILTAQKTIKSKVRFENVHQFSNFLTQTVRFSFINIFCSKQRFLMPWYYRLNLCLDISLYDYENAINVSVHYLDIYCISNSLIKLKNFFKMIIIGRNHIFMLIHYSIVLIIWNQWSISNSILHVIKIWWSNPKLNCFYKGLKTYSCRTLHDFVS